MIPIAPNIPFSIVFKNESVPRIAAPKPVISIKLNLVKLSTKKLIPHIAKSYNAAPTQATFSKNPLTNEVVPPVNQFQKPEKPVLSLVTR